MATDASDRQEDAPRGVNRFQNVNELVLRPKLGSIDEALDAAPAAQARRIALLEHQELEQLIRNAPSDPQPYLQLAKIYQRDHRWKDLLRVLDAGVRHNPDYEPLVMLREDLILGAAEKNYEAARTSHLNHPTRESQTFLDQSELSLASERVRFCSLRFARCPEQIELLIIWAEALVVLGRIDQALPLLEKAASYPAFRARAALVQGSCHEKLAQPLEALSAYRVAAFFRAPPAEPEVRYQALGRAALLAEKTGIIDAAQEVVAVLAEEPSPEQPRWQEKQRQLASMPR